MKKLVTLFTLAIAMVASADVASQNIVGYVNVAIPAGFSFVVPSFNTVGGNGTSCTLADIIPTGWEAANNDSAQLIDATGEPIQQIYYWPLDGGWFDLNDNDINAQEIKTGTGMFVEVTQANSAFTMTGQVATEAYDLELADAGFYFIGNPLPRTITLSEIVPSNWEAANNDSAQLIDASGEPIQQVYYWPLDGGWFDLNDNDVNAQELPAGAGIFVEATQSNFTFTFPAAL